MNRSVIFLLLAFCITVSCLAHNNKNKKDEIDIKIDIDVEDGNGKNGKRQKHNGEKKHHGGHGPHNNEECRDEHKRPRKTSRKPKTHRVPQYECPTGFTLFNRTIPWCLKAEISAESIKSGDAQNLCAAINSNLSNFENQNETDVILEPLYLQINGVSLTVDGRRIDECMKIPKNSHASPCTVNETFYFPHNNTNPSFTIANYYDNQPDSSQTTVNGVFYIEDCLTIYINNGTAMDKKYNDIFCELAVSPIDSSKIYQSRGALCGVAATRKR